MKTLVISDSHDRIHFIEKLIENVKPDFTVFLGDYFDSKDGSSKTTRETALWLKQSIKNKNRWHLIGNHDAHYFFSQNKNLRIEPGFSMFNLIEISKILTQEEIDNCFNLVCFVEGFTLSHSGFHSELFEDIPDESEIAKQCDEALPLLKIGQVPKIVNYWPGWKGCDIQGCTMIRFDELDIIYGIKQIVGHTFGTEVRYNFNNVCLDTGNKHYGLIENGNLTIHEIK